MRRGYIRVRQGGPPKHEQMASMLKSGIDMEDPHVPIYVDDLPVRRRQRSDTPNPLPMRSTAISTLREGDELVVYDAATLGLSESDILAAMGAVGRRGATLWIVTLDQTFTWHPDAAEMSTLASDAGDRIKLEKTVLARRKAVAMGLKGGRPELLTGRALEIAQSEWGNRQITAQQIADKILAETKVKVSIRTLHSKLKPRKKAIQDAERKIR